MPRSTARVIDGLRGLLLVGVVLAAVAAAGYLVGPLGLGFDLPMIAPGEDSTAITATGTLIEPPEMQGSSGTDFEESGSPAQLSSPFTAGVRLLQPRAAERAAYLTLEVGTALVAIAGMVLVFRILGSTKESGPFIRANVRRMQLLAVVVAAGGSAVGMGSGAIDTFLIQRSAVAELFAVEYTLPLLPLVLGAVLAVLAFIWEEGIRMREDTEGLI